MSLLKIISENQNNYSINRSNMNNNKIIYKRHANFCSDGNESIPVYEKYTLTQEQLDENQKNINEYKIKQKNILQNRILYGPHVEFFIGISNNNPFTKEHFDKLCNFGWIINDIISECYSVYKKNISLDEAIKDWEKITGFNSKLEGCMCPSCEPLFQFAEYDENGKKIKGFNHYDNN
jgi:hypothetical protein